MDRKDAVSPEEVLAKVGALAEALRDRRVLIEKIAHCAQPLDAIERTEVFATVEDLARQGSAAWPEESGYRRAAGPTPAALVTIFREALGLAKDR